MSSRLCRTPQGLWFGKWINILIWVCVVAIAVPSQTSARTRLALIVVDAVTGKTVYARRADSLRYPASLTKIMTLYILFQEMRAGRISKNSKLRVSRYAAARPPTRLGLKPGTWIRAEDAILSLVTKSANDVAVVVAEAISGSERAFARRMTRTARRIGMRKTRFRNASGLPNRRQVTTARDMATLAKRIQRDFPKLYRYFAVRKFRFRGRTYYTHNRLLGRFRGTEGIKTGYTRASGYNLVSSVRRHGKQLIGVVLGGRTARARDATMMALITSSFPRAMTRSAAKRKRIARRIPVKPVPVPALKPAPVKARPARKKQPAPMPVIVNTQPAPMPVIVKVQPVLDKQPARKMASADRKIIGVVRINVPLPLPLPVVVTTLDNAASDENEDDSKALVVKMPNGKPNVFASAEPAEFQDPPPLKSAVIQPVAATPGTTSSIPMKPTVLPSPARPAAVAVEPRAQVRETPPGWLIQVGAYARESDAKKQLNLAQNRMSGALRGKRGFTMIFARKNRKYYRARFGGFTRTTALDTCRKLKRYDIRCYTLAP